MAFSRHSLGVAAWLLKQAGALGVEPVKREQESNQRREEDQPCKQPQHTVAPGSRGFVSGGLCLTTIRDISPWSRFERKQPL